MHFLRNGSVIKIITYLEQAIEKDPEFAIAYSELAAVYMILARSGINSPYNKIKKVKELTQKAITLDP